MGEESIGIRELRQRVSAVLERVAGGSTVEITDRGRPVARIVPLRPGPLEQLVQDGRATAPTGDLLDLLDELGLPVEGRGGMLPTAALAELRQDER